MQDFPCRVWAFSNDCGIDATELALLDDEERAHSARLKADADRAAFIKTRAALRAIVGSVIGRPPEHIGFSRNEWGKPFIDAPTRAEFDFSVSHAKSLSAIAVARRASVGVDVEPIRPCPDRIRIAADVFGLNVAQRL